MNENNKNVKYSVYNINNEKRLFGYDYAFKVVFIGNTRTGKSIFRQSIKKKLSMKDINSSLSTVGVDMDVVYLKETYNDSSYKRPAILKMNIWDTTGQERFSYLVQSYYKYSSCFICFFDVYNYETFRDLKEKINDIRIGLFPYVNNSKIVIVGTCCIGVEDKRQRQVSYEEATFYAETIGDDCDYFDFNPFEVGSALRVLKNVSKICMKNIDTIPYTGNINKRGSIIVNNTNNRRNNSYVTSKAVYIDKRKHMSRSSCCSCCCDTHFCFKLYNCMCKFKNTSDSDGYCNSYFQLGEESQRSSNKFYNFSTGNPKYISDSIGQYSNPMCQNVYKNTYY
jgi:small GTP-binding protein